MQSSYRIGILKENGVLNITMDKVSIWEDLGVKKMAS